ncbi:hypothetical protein D9M70_383810 [compost metagenome]
MTMPAKKAPNANDTLKSSAAPKAMPMAAATTASVNSSREPVLATCHSNHGNTRRPAISINAINAVTWRSVCRMVTPMDPDACPCAPLEPPSSPASGGSRTSTRTVARSSTTSHPTAMRPFMVSSTPRLSRALSSTTVLAHDKDKPNIRPLPQCQPQPHAITMPNTVAIPICTTAPGIAMRLTASRSLKEKCRPTPNISSMTPISESCEARWTSATNPGVPGPIMMPDTR